MNAISEETLQQAHHIIQRLNLKIPVLRDLPLTLTLPLTTAQQQAIHHLEAMEREVDQMLTACSPRTFQA